MKTKLLLLQISLIMTALSLSAQDIEKIIGGYKIEATCIRESSGSVFPEDPVTFEILIEKDEDGVESGIQMRFPNGVHGIYYYVPVKAEFLNDRDFQITPGQEFGGPMFMTTISGDGNIEGNLIFMQYVTIMGSTSFQCDCKGKKTGSGGGSIPSLSSSGKNRIYVDAAREVIVFDETLQNQSLTVELINLQGKTIVKKTNTGEPVSIAGLPNGIYLYMIRQEGRMIYSGKILCYKMS